MFRGYDEDTRKTESGFEDYGHDPTFENVVKETKSRMKKKMSGKFQVGVCLIFFLGLVAI